MRNLLAALLVCAPALMAQAPATALKPAPIVSPQVLPDRRVVFRLRAPKAADVTIAGDFWVQEGRSEQMVKGDDGVWSLTTDPLLPDLYSYWFTIDGVPAPDPSNRVLKQGSRTQQSMFTVPGADEAFLENSAVPHGEVRIVYYPSAALGSNQRMHIYFPPSYDNSKMQYPVVYLLHGGGDEDWGWVTVGRVNMILDNLIAAGNAKPMIVVMPNLWTPATPTAGSPLEENAARFDKSLFEDVIPFVESHYRVLPGVANRAAGGLGAGRYHLSELLWANVDKFSSFVFVSGGSDAEHVAGFDKQYPDEINKPANAKRVKVFLGDGKNDASYSYSTHLAAELKQRGYSVTTYATEGTHGWPSFRRCFAEWAQSAFR